MIIKKKKNFWHLWFAWRPVRLDDETIVWMQFVYKAYFFLRDRTEYSLTNPEKDN